MLSFRCGSDSRAWPPARLDARASRYSLRSPLRRAGGREGGPLVRRDARPRVATTRSRWGTTLYLNGVVFSSWRSWWITHYGTSRNPNKFLPCAAPAPRAAPGVPVALASDLRDWGACRGCAAHPVAARDLPRDGGGPDRCGAALPRALCQWR